ncbi:hypothetical protein J4232_03755 [Candidatus Woesearchaeota archaeon]|nr:hypothetical protein [Candidatus Woesearchaeota archaeon]
MVGYEDGQKVDIVKAVFGGNEPIRARYHVGDIGCSVLRGYLDADRAGILEQTNAPSQRGILELYADKRFKKGAFQVGAALVVPARLNSPRIHNAELYEAESVDGKVRVDLKDGILYAKADVPGNIERTAKRFGLEYRIV